MPASSAAWAKLVNDRVTVPLSDVVENGRSAPKYAARIVLAAPLNVLCPLVWSGNGGVTISGSHAASFSVRSLPSMLAARMAVTGRQKLYVYFASQQTMAAS